ncbi:hypothetical protein [Natronobacterium lacisalsi]|uniref:hypothetical protein n=1 Tax=Natronobacterium lacisalsi TaxID=229731 RepID=UPI001EE76EAB|nr:hypothetical protein [Halobiforma lacisalsi]
MSEDETENGRVLEDEHGGKTESSREGNGEADIERDGEPTDDPAAERRAERRECAICGEEVPSATYREHLLKECSGP